jgi:hypothetical protein
MMQDFLERRAMRQDRCSTKARIPPSGVRVHRALLPAGSNKQKTERLRRSTRFVRRILLRQINVASPSSHKRNLTERLADQGAPVARSGLLGTPDLADFTERQTVEEVCREVPVVAGGAQKSLFR